MTRHRLSGGMSSSNAFRFGILGRHENWYVRDLRRAAAELGVATTHLDFQSLQVSLMPAGLDSSNDGHVSGNRLDVWACSEDGSCDLAAGSAILVRSMPLGSLEQVIFRMDVLQAWQAQGIAVVNSPRCLEASIDKWLTLHRLHLAGVQVPPTIACQDRHQAMEAFTQLGEDVLVKPLFGGEGRGIIRLQDKDLAWRTFATLQQLGTVLYLQRFLPHFGYDVRVLFIGGELLSIRRHAREGEYRTNVSQGGWAEPHPLTDVQRELAFRCANGVGGDIVGVDLLPAQDGDCYALEVNAVPGWKAVASCLNVDVASRVVAYCQEKARRMQAACGCIPTQVNS